MNKFDKLKLIRVSAITLIINAIFMMPPLLLTASDKSSGQIISFLLPMSVCFIAGFLLILIFRNSAKTLGTRNGYMSLVIIIAISLIAGSIPYIMELGISFSSAIFESSSGISTTSATIFGEPNMPRAIILWKALQHWAGGGGILLFLIGYYPYITRGVEKISTVESHGFHLNKIASKMRTIVQNILIIYILLTLVAFFYFSFSKASNFDVLLLSLSSISTSAIFTHETGLAYYDSIYIDIGTVLFSVLSAVNFIVYLKIANRHFDEIKRNIELKAFIYIITICTVVIATMLYFFEYHGYLLLSARDALVQVASFATTSGFFSTDYTAWSHGIIFVLICLMMIGGCSASTTGSFKVIRLLVSIKLISRGFSRRIHPSSVKPLRLGDSIIEPKTVNSVVVFTSLYIITIIFSTLILSLQNLSLETTFAAVLGMLSNSGITFGEIGISANYSMFCAPLQIFLSILMIVGKVGVLSTIMVFIPSFWNPNKRYET